ncbi:MAG: hypothetical protein JWN46_2177, partial [Acidimicrobiales bacterium]|nr:hypothetical protein [Acidimicrobiales bacterium]
MADALFVLITILFFAGAGAFVHLCDRIIGPDEHAATLPSGALEVVEPPPPECGVEAVLVATASNPH